MFFVVVLLCVSVVLVGGCPFGLLWRWCSVKSVGMLYLMINKVLSTSVGKHIRHKKRGETRYIVGEYIGCDGQTKLRIDFVFVNRKSGYTVKLICYTVN